MIELETKGGKRILVNVNQICVVAEEAKGGNSCMIYMPDADPWYVKGTFKEIDDKIWRADRCEGEF